MSNVAIAEVIPVSEFIVEGCAFTRFVGAFEGETTDEYVVEYGQGDDPVLGPVDFRAWCSLVLPTDPSAWNRRLYVEPLHGHTVARSRSYVAGEITRRGLLGDDYLFGGRGKRWGYASISIEIARSMDISTDDGLAGTHESIRQPPLSLGTALHSAGPEILELFAARPLTGLDPIFRDARTTAGGYGQPRRVVGLGLSRSAFILRSALARGADRSRRQAPVFSAALPIVGGTTWYEAVDTSHEAIPRDQPMLLGHRERVLALNSELEVVFGGKGLRTEGVSNRYQLAQWEIAGAAHMTPTDLCWLALDRAAIDPSQSFPRDALRGGNRLDWKPVARAALAQLTRWLGNRTNKPLDALIEEGPKGFADSSAGVPDLLAGIRRDALHNATGGVRLPEVELGLGTYGALGPGFAPPPSDAELFRFLGGTFVANDALDLSPTLLPLEFEEASRKVVAAGHVLPRDAATLLSTCGYSNPAWG